MSGFHSGRDRKSHNITTQTLEKTTLDLYDVCAAREEFLLREYQLGHGDASLSRGSEATH